MVLCCPITHPTLCSIGVVHACQGKTPVGQLELLAWRQLQHLANFVVGSSIIL